MQKQLTFDAMRSTDPRLVAGALVGTQDASGRVVEVVQIEVLRTPPFTTTITYEVDPIASGDVPMPRTPDAVVYIEMARRALERGGERTVSGFWQNMTEAEILARYTSLIERSNA